MAGLVGHHGKEFVIVPGELHHFIGEYDDAAKPLAGVYAVQRFEQVP
jgi:hypothetical protein